MEENKKSKKGLVLGIIAVLIILGLVGYICYDKGIFGTGTSQKSVATGNTKTNKDGTINLDINNESIKSLYNRGKIINNLNASLQSTPVKDITSLKASDMTNEEKISFVITNSNLESIPQNAWLDELGVTMAFSEDKVKNACENTFGPNTYKRVNKFELGGTFTYNDKYGAYVTNSTGGGTTGWSYTEAMLNAKKYSDRIEITTAVVLGDSGSDAFYKDSALKHKVSDAKGVCDSEEYNVFNDNKREKCLNDFITKNKDKLYQYTYTYKLNNDGFYYFTKVKRTKE